MKIKVKSIISIILAICLLYLTLYLKLNFDKMKEEKKREEMYSVKNKEDVLSFVNSHGFSFDEISFKSKRIPFVFGDVYNEYNAIQKEQGFDLSKYKGKEVLIYKSSRKDSETESYAEIIVYENLIIGCSVHSETNGNDIKPLIMPK